MTYTLRFLPAVEEDAIGGYAWYEGKSPGLGEDFLRLFYACANEIPEIHCFTQESMANSDAVCSEGFRMPFTSC